MNYVMGSPNRRLKALKPVWPECLKMPEEVLKPAYESKATPCNWQSHGVTS